MRAREAGRWDVADSRVLHRLQRQVEEVAQLEDHAATTLAAHRRVVHANPEVLAAFDGFITIAKRHRDALDAYRGRDARDESGAPPILVVRERRGEPPISDALRDVHATFSVAVMSYAVLVEFALRLYDRDLRELAPRHLSEYAAAAQLTSELIFSAVVDELVEDGADCECVCPMCSIGVCGCVSATGVTFTEAWRDATSTSDAAPGFLIQRPRVDSALHVAGVERGDRLLEVDGHAVASIFDIQAAIRAHPIGDDVRLLLESGPAVVRHVSDYLPQ